MNVRRLLCALVAVAVTAPAMLACDTVGGADVTEDATAVTQVVSAAPAAVDDLSKAKKKFFVAPDGRPDGKGNKKRPWDLQTALNHPSAVEPGSVIWLRGGTYSGSFTSKLIGTPSARITVREFPGEHATIDAGLSDAPALTVNGAYTTFWGFELTSTNPNRIVPADGKRAEGVSVYAPGTRLVNLAIHDGGNGVGFWEQAVDSEISGCVIYNNGLERLDSGKGAGHGIYVQNKTGQKTIRDTIVLNNFGYGAHGYAQSGWVQNIRFEGSVFFNNGSPTAKGGHERNPNLFLGTTDNPMDDLVVTSCFTYQPPLAIGGSMRFGYAGVSNGHIEVVGNYMADGSGGVNVDGWRTAVVTNNTMAITETGNLSSAPTIALVHTPTGVGASAYTWNGNTYFDTSKFVPFSFNSPNFQSFDEWRAASGFDAASSYVTTKPTGTKVFVRPNPDEPGRANVIVYNFAGATKVGVDLSSVLQSGQSYEVRNVQDFLGAPVATGVFNGERVQVPLTGLSVAMPYGYDFTPAPTGPEFNVFVVLVRREANKEDEE